MVLYEKAVLKEVRRSLNRAIKDCIKWRVPVPAGKILFEDRIHSTRDWFARTAMTDDGRYVISVSASLFLAYRENVEEALRNILLHELAHTCKDGMNHGKGWKKWVDRMNAHGARVNPKPYSKKEMPGWY